MSTIKDNLIQAGTLEEQARQLRLSALKQITEGENGELIKLAAAGLYFGGSQPAQALWDILRKVLPEDLTDILDEHETLRVLAGLNEDAMPEPEF